MCRCDYRPCKEGCDCRCHIERTSELSKLSKAYVALLDEKSLINQAWINALHNNDIVDMKDADGENMKAICLFVDEELKRLRSTLK